MGAINGMPQATAAITNETPMTIGSVLLMETCLDK
jgi:hypothetical protein